jgi:phosphatidylethanolamine/phosphatidyl-N-methylethanolamine N-methyltransferase
MSDTIRVSGERRPATNKALFFRRWLRNPLQMGSIIPSSPALCRRIASAIEAGPDDYVLELGAGTGVITRALLASGVPPHRLVVVEIVPEMAEFLRESLPGVNVICGDAFDLPAVLPERMRGRIGTAICGIPWSCCRWSVSRPSWTGWKPWRRTRLPALYLLRHLAPARTASSAWARSVWLSRR